jgi:hypothetical protein
MTQEDASRLWYEPELDVFVNRWFSDYGEARRSLEVEGGYLLPYGRQYFVCEAEVIRALGLEPGDEDWERVGRDCARPADVEAYGRLRGKRERVARQGAAG